jgi:hypothetical protein
MNPTSCLFGSRFAWAQTEIFSAKPCSKILERHQLFFGLWLANKEFQHSARKTKIEQHFGRFFSSNKSAPANRNKRFYANRDPNKQGVDFFLHEAAVLP